MRCQSYLFIYLVDKRSEEKSSATFVAADHDNSLSELFPPRIAKIVTPGIKIGKTY